MLRTIIIGLLAITLAAAPALADYTSGGTFVVKTPLGTLADNGGVVCDGANGDGIGGGCLAFPLPGADGTVDAVFIGVRDNAADKAVAFQVCIDNNGDGICGGPQTNERCRDQIFFSHSDGGRFFNALGPLPPAFLRGCEDNGGFPGYVVLLCTGVHDDAETGPHEHTLTSGTIAFTPKGSGYGDFCGGGGEGGDNGFREAAAKAYVVR